MHAISINKYAGLGILLGTMILFSHQRFINLHDAIPHGWLMFILHASLLIVAGFLLLDKGWQIRKLHLSISFFPGMYLLLLAANILLVSLYHPSDPVLPSINQNVFPVASLLTLLLLPFGLSYALVTRQVADAGFSGKSIFLCDFLLLCLWLLLYPVVHLVAMSFVSWIL